MTITPPSIRLCAGSSLCAILVLFSACKKENNEPEAEPTPPTPMTPVYGDTIMDVDGNLYPTVIIDGRHWMAQNLRASHYRNFDPIPNVTDDFDWIQLNTGAWCHYNNDPGHDTIYGKLYNGHVAADLRGACPQGWHVPSDDDWKSLEIALGMPAAEADMYNLRGGNQGIGGILKSSSDLWTAPNNGATNAVGFTALPGGARFEDDGHFNRIGEHASWWAAFPGSTSNTSVIRILYRQYTTIGRIVSSKRVGRCIRCVKD